MGTSVGFLSWASVWFSIVSASLTSMGLHHSYSLKDTHTQGIYMITGDATLKRSAGHGRLRRMRDCSVCALGAVR